LSINLEILGGSPTVQHYIEEVTPTGRRKIGVISDLMARKIGPISEAHNRQETAMFAKGIERPALRQGLD
jgi:hypothetical protein